VEADGDVLRGDPLTEGDELVDWRAEMVPREEFGEGERVRSGVDGKAIRSEFGGGGVGGEGGVRGGGACGGGGGGFDEKEAGLLERFSEGGDSEVGILLGVKVAAGEGLGRAR
jgi:hypothetical protein